MELKSHVCRCDVVRSSHVPKYRDASTRYGAIQMTQSLLLSLNDVYMSGISVKLHCWAWLVLRWPSLGEQLTSVCNYPHRATQPPTLLRMDISTTLNTLMLSGRGVEMGIAHYIYGCVAG